MFCTDLTLRLNNSFYSQDTYEMVIADDLSAVKFYDQIHYIYLAISENMDVTVSQHSLPDRHRWFPPMGSITSYFNEFIAAVEQLEEFYDNINTIDELCFVVDPIEPSTKSDARIFRIGLSLCDFHSPGFVAKRFFCRWIRSKMFCKSGDGSASAVFHNRYIYWTNIAGGTMPKQIRTGDL